MNDEELPSVCVITQPLSSAGVSATTGLLTILSALTTVSLVTPSLPPGSDLHERYHVVELGVAGTGEGIIVPAVRFVRNQIRMAQEIWHRDEELVIFFGATSYLLPFLAAKIAGKTIVAEPRGDVPLTLRLYWERRVPGPVARVLAGFVWFLERVAFWIADGIIVYTPGVADQLSLGRFSDKVYTEGARYVDTEEFFPRVPFENRERIVGYIGRLDEEKGIRTLAEVAKRLPDDILFRFVGDGSLRGWLDVDLSSEIEAGSVNVVGWVPHKQVPEELSRMRLLIMPSEPTEGLPTVILEAMACGTPVFATPVSGVTDLVTDGYTGFLMDDRGPATLAQQIESILSDGDLEQVSSDGRDLIEREYTLDAAVERYSSILKELMI